MDIEKGKVVAMNDDLVQPHSLTDGPVLKIFLCGPLRILRRKNTNVDLPPIYQDIPPSEWGERPGPTLNLLKLLLCSENRHATKTFLADTLWPESGEKEGRHSLSQATRVLRVLLRTNEEEPKSESKMKSLLYESPGGEGFQIADQTLLWVDVDAFEDAMKQATRAERQKHQEETIVWWERAYVLGKAGSFLPDDVYREWTNARRLSHEMLFPRCVRRLAECYVAEERYGEAEEVLRPYWTAHLTDEDMLTLLMQTLQVQGLGKEALQCYEQSVRALDEELGVKPHASTTALADRIQEQQHKRERIVILDTTVNMLQTSKVSTQQHHTPDNLSGMVYGVDDLSETTSSTNYTNDVVSRREVSKKIVTIGKSLLTMPSLLSLIQLESLLHDEEILSVCATSLPIFWRLYFDGQLSEVQHALPNYISQLALLVRQPSVYQRQAAHLASKAHQLACMLMLQEQDYGAALIHVDQALLGASIAEDTSLKVASLIRKALVYRYIHRHLKKCPDQMLEAYQEAMQYSSFISPLLRGRLYTGLAEGYSELQQEYKAKHALELAYKIFPENPQNDPNYSSTHFKLPERFEAIMYLNLNQVRKAWSILEKIDSLVPMTVIPDRVELSLDQARASLLLGDMQQSCEFLEVAASSASAFGSQLRTQEAYNIYRQIYTKWPSEQHVKALADCFH